MPLLTAEAPGRYGIGVPFSEHVVTRVTLVLVSAVLLGGCSGKEDRLAQEPERVTSPAPIDLAAIGRGERQATLRALRMPHRYLAARLGAHRVR